MLYTNVAVIFIVFLLKIKFLKAINICLLFFFLKSICLKSFKLTNMNTKFSGGGGPYHNRSSVTVPSGGGGHLEETTKTGAPCHSRCGPKKNLPYPKEWQWAGHNPPSPLGIKNSLSRTIVIQSIKPQNTIFSCTKECFMKICSTWVQ